MGALLAACALPASAHAQVELDPATDTVRVAGRLDGALTRPADGAAAPIGLKYVREHRAALGLTLADLDTLADPTVRAAGGIRQVRWRQEVDGIQVADAELRVNVDADGRVINVLGSPASELPSDTTPRLAEPQPDAELTIFAGRLAYRYQDEAGPGAIYDTVSDADTGKVLKRTNLVKSVDARVWEHHPGTPASVKSLDGWLLPGVTNRLEGPWVHAYVDSSATATGTVTNVAPGVYPWTAFNAPGLGCSTLKPCGWDGTAQSRATNRSQSTVQAFYLANRFREHLAGDPIAFDGFGGADKLRLETDNGTGLNNANMFTPPDGQAPLMQMFLWHGSGYRSVNSADDASILFHEYTHGLTGRLVVDADGVQALGSWQAGAMAEGWSDFYAKDYLVAEGLETDTPAPGEVDMGSYVDATAHSMRRAALDCPVGSAGSVCPGGGFTYGDFADGGPEYHDDGEIWAQTLWDLRTALADRDATLAIVTQAMRLSPPEPSFLDMRNAILQADTALFNSSHHLKIWTVFANRGMGFFATTVDGADTAPVENTAMPPDGGPTGTLTGTVRNLGSPVAGAKVRIGDRVATTAADGTYTIAGLPALTYEHAVVTAPGFDRLLLDAVTVPGTADAQLRRNWASPGSGAEVTLTGAGGGENAPIGCGPKQAVDGLQASTWSTQQAADKPMIVKLAKPIDITGLAIDPTAGCGDGLGASTAQYAVHVASSSSGPWTQIAAGTFGAAHRHQLNPVAATASNVAYVRLTPMTTQTPGASYIDVSEFAVYSAAPAPVTTIVSGPSGIESDPRPTFTFSSDQPGGTFRCRLDGANVPCTTTYRPATPLVNGRTYTFEVVAVNQDGTPDATPETRTFTINSELPITTLSETPGPLTDATSVRFVFSGNGNSLQCSRDGAAFTSCVSPQDWAPEEGQHTFAVRAVNVLGADPSPETFTFTVDRTAPATEIAGATVDGDAATFVFSSVDATAVRHDCTFRGQTAPCTSPKAYAGLPDGEFPFTVVATDALGHTTTRQTTVRVAAAPYETRLTAVPDTLLSRDEAEFEFSSPAAQASFQCSVDRAAFTACASPMRLTALADGAHTFAVRAVGPGTRVDATPAEHAFTVDTTPPDTYLTWGPPPILTTRDFWLAFAASEGATFRCSVDGAAAAACASPLALVGLSEGAHSVVVTAVDTAGNADPTPARTDFTVIVPGLPPAQRPTPTATPTPERNALTSATAPRTVSRRTGKVKVTLRGAKGAKVSVQARIGSRVVGKATWTLTRSSLAFQLKLDRKRLQRRATVTVIVKGRGTGLTTVTRTLKVRLR